MLEDPWIFPAADFCALWEVWLRRRCWAELYIQLSLAQKESFQPPLRTSQQVAVFEQMLSRQWLNVNFGRLLRLSLSEACCMWALQAQAQSFVSGENSQAKALSFLPLYMDSLKSV